MRIFFINGSYSSQYYGSLSNATHGNLQIASHIFQQSIIKGMGENGVDYEVVSTPFVPCSPLHNSLVFTPYDDYFYDGKIVGKTIRFCTLLGFKENSIRKNLFNYLYRRINNLEYNEDVFLLMYSPYGPYLQVGAELKKLFPSIKIALIITDRFFNNVKKLKETTWRNRIRLYHDTKNIEKNISSVDKYILLAERLVEFVPSAIDNHIIVEGLYDGKIEPVFINKMGTQKTLLYTGSLDIHTSVKELVDAFMMTNNDSFKLQICGTGHYANYIIKKSKTDKRIEYLGLLPRKDVMQLQRQATVLINPRMPKIADTPYSFPSKTMEYLTSGTPMLGFRLEGIPSDYYNYFFAIKEETIESIKETIERVLLLPQKDLDTMAKTAYEFVSSKKSTKEQVNKIVEYLRE